MKKDILGNKIKDMEKKYSTSNRIDNNFIVVRLDGKNFSSLTKKDMKLEIFDDNFANLMESTMVALVEKFNAKLGYVQSDEITLIFSKSTKETSTFMFDGKVFKLCSILASYAGAHFNAKFPTIMGIDPNDYACFDCRVIGVDKVSSDNMSEVSLIDALWWRILDAKKNAVQNYAQNFYRHSEIKGISGKELIDKMKTEKNFQYYVDKKVFAEGILYYKVKEKTLIPLEYRKYKSNNGKKYCFKNKFIRLNNMDNINRDKLDIIINSSLMSKREY